MRHGSLASLDVGTIVEGTEGISRVVVCVHGNKYYAWMGYDADDAGLSETQRTEVVSVTDDTAEQRELSCGC